MPFLVNPDVLGDVYQIGRAFGRMQHSVYAQPLWMLLWPSFRCSSSRNGERSSSGNGKGFSP